MTVVVRGKISSANEWTDQQVIFRGAARSLHAERLAFRLAG